MPTICIECIKQVVHHDLCERYENKLELPCSMKVGQTFIIDSLDKPANFCESAWQSIYPFVMTLYYGGSDIYSGWMKDKHSCMISCNDGFRPMSFYIRRVSDDTQCN